MAEVGGDEAGVTGLLPEPGRGGVAQGVGGDALLESGPLGGAADDRGEDRRLQALASRPQKTGVSAGAWRSARRRLSSRASGAGSDTLDEDDAYAVAGVTHPTAPVAEAYAVAARSTTEIGSRRCTMMRRWERESAPIKGG